ncbi:hypothetical protein [uncultured Kordia sp.]|uniref:hypothetical protein n=1 Tax=uncultured Kordia sp. TaxID=507699 RepID=UPI0026225D0C|nr:hypothetical protein [uncultured Kordia sp.]
MPKFIEITDLDDVVFQINVDHIVSYAAYDAHSVISLLNIEKIQTTLTVEEINTLISTS